MFAKKSKLMQLNYIVQMRTFKCVRVVQGYPSTKAELRSTSTSQESIRKSRSGECAPAKRVLGWQGVLQVRLLL